MKFLNGYDKVTKAYLDARASVVSISKDKKGQVGVSSYKYATLDALLEAMNDVLIPLGAVISQELVGDQSTLLSLHQAEVSDKNGSRTALFGTSKLGIATSIVHESGQVMVGDTFWFDATIDYMIKSPSAPQGLGIWVTYFKRYALGSFLGIPLDEDTDGVMKGKESGKESKSTNSNNKATPQEAPKERKLSDGTLANPTLHGLYDEWMAEKKTIPSRVELQEFFKSKKK